MKLKGLIYTVCAVACLNTISMAKTVVDMPIGWSKDAVTEAVNNNILNVENGYVRPLDMLTRAEMAYGIVNAFDATEKADLNNYIDISPQTKYYDEISKAVAMGVISGYGNGKLKPEDNISREEMFAVLHNALKLKTTNLEVLNKFNDKDLIADWAKASAASMVQNGYISGNIKGNLKPKDDITREEFAQVMKNIFKGKYQTVNKKAEVPTLLSRDTWYKGKITKDKITKIIIVDTYRLTGRESETWYADKKGVGDVTCYIRETELIIVGNGSGKIYANEDSSCMFDNFNALSTIEIGILDTSKVINMNNMFNYCISLTNLDLSKFDTNKVTDMSNMFNHCTAISKLNLNNFVTTKTTNMANMFTSCWSLEELDISNFDTRKTKNMTKMFYDCGKLKNLKIGKNFSSKGDGTTNSGL